MELEKLINGILRMHMPKIEVELKNKAKWVRTQSMEMCVAGGGHLVSAFSCTDLLVALYYGEILCLNPKNSEWEDRDRFILSKGHATSALYAILADLGYFSIKDLQDYCKFGSKLGSHPDKVLPGIEATSGSLGHGLGIAAGMALAAKLDQKDYRSVVLMGDGECSEGEVWESALFAARHQLNNLVGIIDRNQICVTDFTKDCICLDPLAEKWLSFGWDVAEIDGHSYVEILKAFSDFRNRNSKKPLMIIAHTVKGKGVSFMENKPMWHTKVPAGEQIALARKELACE